MVQKAQLQGAGDGTAVPAGYIGETLETTAANYTPPDLVNFYSGATLTLTTGVWLVSASGFVSGASGFTGIEARLNIKGAGIYTDGKTNIKQECPTAQYATATFAPQAVVVASGDANKTVVFETRLRGAISPVDIYMVAVRIA